jgi:hypothetical protein
MGIFDRLFGKGTSVPGDDDFRVLLAQSMEELRMKTGAHDGLWKLSEAAWAVDQDTGTIIFTSPDGTKATCPVQIIGTYNTADGTWLWGWDHPSVQPPLQEHARKVKAYGEAHGIERFTTRKIACTEDDAWEFTAVACKLADAQGAYRGPSGTARVFMTFGEVCLSKARGASAAVPPPLPGASASASASVSKAALPVDVAAIQESARMVKETVLAYIRAYEEWNAAAMARLGDADPVQKEAAWERTATEYDALMNHFCAETVQRQGYSVGDDSAHDAQREKIVSLSVTGPKAVVRTKLTRDSGFTLDYEYQLVSQAGSWRLASLLYVDGEGRYECL